MSKYNNKKVMFNGITFDSEMECDYYKMLLEDSNVDCFSMQLPFALIPDYELKGKKVRGVKYVCDFYVKYNDGSLEVIDVKGFVTPDFKIKKKLFETNYKIPLKCITYSKIDGGWIELDELKKARSKRKKEKEQKLRGSD